MKLLYRAGPNGIEDAGHRLGIEQIEPLTNIVRTQISVGYCL